MSGSPYRILSLTGGGARGIFQAVLLRHLQNRISGKIPQAFDLIAGTSTGSLTALALAMDVNLDAVIELYREKSQAIFHPRPLSGLRRGPRYNQAVLRKALVDVLGERTLADARTNVLIAASSADDYSYQLFSSISALSGQGHLTAVDVALASCAAPTYFPAVRPKGSMRTYLDGGLWANDPSAAALIFARERLGISNNRIRVLTIGTGEFPQGVLLDEINQFRTYSPNTVQTVFDLMFQTQERASEYFTKSLIGHRNYLKVSPPYDRRFRLTMQRAP